MPEPIAIIGTACRFPGGCDSPSKLWELLKDPRDLSKKVPLDRFNVDNFYHPEATHHGTTNATKSYFLEKNIAHFDAPFFNIQPMESDAVDPQQRVLLETVYDSLCTAGLPMENLRGSSTAVYVGMMCDDWSTMVSSDVETLPTYTATGLARSIVSNRISYIFDWHGPSMTIDTACSSSLVAVHQAVQSLRSGESSLAIAAGTNLILSPNMYVTETNLRMLSPNGRCAMWDSAADGYARGEGVAAVVLKTLSQAIADGDHIECIIRETGVNQDGRTTGLTMPSNIAQTALIQDTYRRAGLDINNPDHRPQLFHAHGTGTQAGDPQEAEAISTALFPSGFKADKELFVGSIKTVIGHTEGSAGLASLIGSALAMKHGIIPPNLHFSELSHKVAPFYTHLKIPTEPLPWPKLAPGQVKRTSVNSFGFGGTNAHAIIESFENDLENILEPRSIDIFTPLVFSAASEKSLRNMLSTYSTFLSANDATDLHDVAITLGMRRSTLPYRTYVPVRSKKDLPDQLKALADAAPNDLDLSIRRLQVSNPAILGVFTGQGAQWPRMGACLLETSIFAQERIAWLDSILQQLPVKDRPTWTIKDELLAGKETSRIAEAAVSQPLCLAIQVVLVDILRAAGIQFKAVVGHSSGEIGAAYAAGLLSAEDALQVAYYRGLHAKHASSPTGANGAMMAVGSSHAEALEICASPRFKSRVQVAAVNSSSSITLSGDEDAIDEVFELMKAEEKFARKLKVDTAYHSAHMLPCAEPYLESMNACKIQPVDHTGPIWFSSVKERQVMSKETLSDKYWIDNMCNAVLFSGAVSQAASEAGPFDLAIEIGPHPALKGPATATLEEFGFEAPYVGLLSRTKNDVHELSTALGSIWMHLGSGSVQFDMVDKLLSGLEGNRKILADLPSYPFDHQREYWAGSRVSNHSKFRRSPPNPLLGTECSEANTTQERQWRNILRPSEISWLSGHRLQGQMVFPATGYVSMAIEATKKLTNPENIACIKVADLEIGRAIAFGDDGASIEVVFNVNVLETTEKTMTTQFACYSINNDGNAVLNAKGKVLTELGSSTPETLENCESDPFNMVNVDQTEFYQNLTKIGYDYSEPFRGVSQIQRKPGYATGLIEDQSGLSWEDDLTFHPGMLDTALQTAFAAWSFPGDGQIWSLHVPTRFESLVFNPHFSPLVLGKQGSFKYETFIRSSSQGNVTADIHLYTADGKNTCIQIENATLVPFSPGSPKDDLPLFSSFKMKPAAPDGQLAAMGETISSYEAQVYKDVDRISFWYIRNVVQTITAEEREQMLPHFRYYLRWCERMIAIVSQGEHPKVSPECLNDERKDITELLSKYEGRKDIRFVEVVGDHLVEVIRSGTSMLEYMNQDDLMLSFYENGLAAGPNNRWMSRIVAQIAHRYPRMNIFEIGAGTGASTKTILPEVGSAFGSYTFTDVSSGFFPEAEERFKDYANRMIFKTFNTELPPNEQGFTEGQYDVVIASNVLHISADMEKCMANVRRLLKPGGYLLTLEVTNSELLFSGMTVGTLPDWWSAAENGRPWGPGLTLSQWDSLLQKTGFSGIDTITPDISDSLPVSVFVSQAIDDRVALLRNPLSLTTEENLDTLVVIGGATLPVFGIVEDVTANLSSMYTEVKVFDTIEELMVSDSAILPGATILSLVDLDEPLMKTLTPEKFACLQKVFEVAGTLVLVSRGCRADEPHSMMLVGIGRTVKTEYPNMNLQLFDIERIDDSTANMLSEALLRHHFLKQWGNETEALLWSSEPEVLIQNQRALIPRLLPSIDKNQRYNSQRRIITKEVDPKKETIEMAWNGAKFELRDVSPLRLADASPSEYFSIRTVFSSFQSLKIGSAGFLRLVYGITSSSDTVIALSPSSQSPAIVPSNWCVPVAGHAVGTSPSSFISSVAANIIAMEILSSVPEHGVLVVREADEGLSSYILQGAKAAGTIKTVFLTSRVDKDTPQCLYVHPRISQHNLKELIPANTSVYADFSQGGDALSGKIRKCLPSQCLYASRSSLLDNDITVPQPSSREIVSQLLQQAVATTSYLADSITIPLNSISEQSVFEPLSIVDWSVDSAVVKVQPIDTGIIFRPDRTYFFVGLAGELGQSLCQWMILHGAKNFALCSRSPKVNPKFIEAMSRQGANVMTFPLDITSRKSLFSCHREICRTMPAIGGVINGAMILQDSVFENMSYEQFMKVTKPKVEGSKLLDQLFHDTPLDFFVVTSSITAATGFSGQSNYSAANTFMASLMYQRRKRGVPGSAMNIPAVLGVGYAAQEDNFDFDYFTTLGYINVSEQDFCTLFAEAVLSGRPDSLDEAEVVSGVNYVPADLEVAQIHARDIKFAHYILNAEQASSGGTKATAQVKVQLQGVTSEDEIFEIVKDSFLVNLKKILQISADDDINLSTPLVEQGLDSLVAVMVRSWFLKEIDVDIPVLKILDGSSISDLLNLAISKIPASLNGGEEVKSEAEVSSGLPPPTLPENTLPAAIVETTSDSASTSSPLQTPSESETSSFELVGSDKLLDSTELEALDEFAKSQRKLAIQSSRLTREPMSFGQARFWFLNHFFQDKTPFNFSTSARMTGPLRVAAFERALDTVIQRHESLRTRFTWSEGESGTPVQEISSRPLLKLETKRINSDDEAAYELEKLQNHEYDLEDWGSIRAILLTLSDTVHYFLIGCHHIAMDGQSMHIVFSELESLYNGKLLPPIGDASQYRSFAARQRNDYESGKMQADVDFFRGIIQEGQGPIQPFSLTHLPKRKILDTYRHHRASTRLGAELASKVKQISRKLHSTNFHFYLTILQALVFRMLPDTNDFCVGIADSNRLDKDSINTVGCLVNLLPLKFSRADSSKLDQAVKLTRTKVYSALQHSRVPFDVLVNELGVDRSATHTPIFQIFMDYRLGDHEKSRLAGCEAEISWNNAATGYDLHLEVLDTAAGESLVVLKVQEALYSKEAADLLLGAFVNILEQATQNPADQTDLSSPQLWSKKEIDDAVALGKGPELEPKWPATIAHRVDEMVNLHPNVIALKDGHGNVLTYTAMADRVNTIAATLLKHISDGDSVAVFQEPSADWICSLLAIFRVGAAYVPLDLKNGLQRLAKAVDVGRPQVILHDNLTEALVPDLRPTAADLINVAHIPTIPGAKVPNKARAESTAAILFTSGSTGVPKGVVLPHSCFALNAEGLEKSATECPIVVLQQIALSFDFSLHQIFMALTNGGTLCVLSSEQRGDPSEITKILKQEGVTDTLATPTEYGMWFDAGSDIISQCSSWKRALVGGEALPKSIVRCFRDLNSSGPTLFDFYGPVEATIALTRGEVDMALVDTEKPIPVGRIIPNYSVFIFDEALQPLPIGVPGEIVVGGPGIAAGYLGQEELTNEKFITVPSDLQDKRSKARGWNKLYRTGDRGRLNHDGTLTYEGRINGDDQIKLRGIRIELGEIENEILKAADGKLSQAVVAVHGTDADKFLVAYVVLSSQSKSSSDEILASIKAALPLPNYMRRSLFIAIDSIPMNVHGKMDRKALHNIPLPDIVTSGTSSDPGLMNDKEKQLAELWEEMLPVAGSTITAGSDFFHVGGNSLLLVKLQRRLKETFAFSPRLTELMNSSTLSDMARLLEGGSADVVNWEAETAIPGSWTDLAKNVTTTARNDHMTVVLTGATGYIGRHLLPSLLESPLVSRVICLVRDKTKLITNSERIMAISCDFNKPNLGLASDQLKYLSDNADIMVHCAANRSFWDDYQALRAVNFQAVRDIASLCLGRRVPLHFFSSGAVADHTDHLSPANPHDGYLSSKWAAEKFLYGVSQNFGLPVHIHRPSAAIEDTQYTVDRNVQQDFVECAQRVGARPDVEASSGHMDLSPTASFIVKASEAILDRQAIDSSLNFKTVLYKPDQRFDIQLSIAPFSGDSAWASLPTIDMLLWMGEAKKNGFPYVLTAQNIVMGSKTGQVISRR